MKYQFCNEVVLRYDEQGYHISVCNEDIDDSSLTAEQLKNPMLAQVRFIDAIRAYFYHKISDYIKRTDRKQGLGCTSKHQNCLECIKTGFNLEAGSECYLNQAQAENILSGDNL